MLIFCLTFQEFATLFGSFKQRSGKLRLSLEPARTLLGPGNRSDFGSYLT